MVQLGAPACLSDQSDTPDRHGRAERGLAFGLPTSLVMWILGIALAHIGGLL